MKHLAYTDEDGRPVTIELNFDCLPIPPRTPPAPPEPAVPIAVQWDRATRALARAAAKLRKKLDEGR